MATKRTAESKSVKPNATKVASVASNIITLTKKMTKSELVRFVAEQMQVTAKQSAAFFDLLASLAIDETKKNGEFIIPGLGKLVRAHHAARVGRNPQTGEAIKIKAKIAVKFRVAKAAKDFIAPPK